MKHFNYCIGIPTINRADLLEESLTQLAKNHPDIMVLVIDNGAQCIENIGEKTGHKNVVVFTSESNLGVSGSWNRMSMDAFSRGYDAIWIANDDIVLGSNQDEMQEFVLDAVSRNKFVVQQGTWCSFILPKKVFQSVGLFDEEFFPAYFEDNDYAYRLKLSHNPHEINSILNPIVYRNSQTIAKDPSLNTRFVLNKQRFIAKWGGEPTHESFVNPFNKSI